MIAITKRKLELHLNMGNNISNAREMKDGIESNGGVAGTMVAIIEPNVRTRRIVKKVNGISNYTNFEYQQDGKMRVYTAYGLGKGKLLTIPGSGHFVPLEPIMEEENDFNPDIANSKDTSFNPKQRNISLARLCPLPSCTGVILDGQEDSHEHQFDQLPEEDLSGLDLYKTQWGEEILGSGSSFRRKRVYEVA